MNDVIQKIESIQSVFLETQLCYATHNDITGLISYMEQIPVDFRSIAYESDSMAVAKLKLPFLPIVEKIEYDYYFRVTDGCGYYDGSFRHRQTVLSQQLTAYLPEAAMPMYDQGVGRSL